MAMTIEQQRALALARARQRAQQRASGPSPFPNPLEPAGRLWNDFVNWGQDAEGYEPSAVPWLDPISAGANKAVDSIPIAGPFLTDMGNQFDAAVNNALGFEQQAPEDRAAINQAQQERFPQAALAGQVAGTVAPLVALGSTQLGGQLLGVTGNLGQQVGMGILSGGAIGGTDTLARGGSPQDAMNMAMVGMAGGGALPIAGHVAGPVLRSMAGQRPSGGAELLAPALRNDRITSTSEIERLLMQGGPEMRIADLGPNLQAQSAALATRPGSAQQTIIDALSQRQSMANERIRAMTDDILGPAPVPSYLQADIRANQQALSPAYQDVLRGAGAVDTSPIALGLDSMAVSTRGPVQSHAEQIRRMLDVPGTGELDRSPQTLLSIRQAIDDMMTRATGNNEIAFLASTRQQVDDLLASAAPGIKDVDAQFAELARQSNALGTGNPQATSGRQFLGTGPEAPVPAEVADMMSRGALPEGTLIGPSGEAFRFSQSARAEIERIIGTNANDRLQLQRLLRGEGSWNYQRLSTIFDPEKADALMDVVNRETVMAQTENLALHGSRTAPLTAAQRELFEERNKGITRAALNMRLGDAAASALDAVAGGMFRTRRERDFQELAELLMAGQGNRAARDDIARALFWTERGLLPPASGPLLVGPDRDRRQPLRIVVNYAQ